MTLKSFRILIFGLTLIGASICLGPFAFAATSFWSQTGAGSHSWNTPANWDNSDVPETAGDIANFQTPSGTSSQGVTLDAAIALGQLNLTNPTTSYTISNGSGGSFTFDNLGVESAIVLNTGGASQTINADITIAAPGLNITNGNAIDGNTLTIGGNISGLGALNKLGSGNLILTGTNTYAGNTYFGPTTGTGTINAGKITLSGGDNILPTNSVVYFHPVTYPLATNTGTTLNNPQTYISTLDIGSTNQTLSTLRLPGASNGADGYINQLPTGANVTISGSGGTLTLNGDDFYVGITNNVNGLNPSGITHTVNMSTLTNFVFDNPNKNVGVHLSGNRTNSQNNVVGTLTLAENSTIKAANLLVGDLGPSGVAGGNRSILNIGSGNTILEIGSSASTGQINVGYSGRSRGDIVLAAGGQLTIRGFGGGSTPLPEFMVGLGSNSSSTINFIETVDFSAGTVNAIVTRMDLATSNNAAGGRGGGNTSNFTLGATSGPEGFTVETLNIGRIIGEGVGLAQPFSSTATVTLNNSSGVLNATTINMAENTITDDSTVAKTVSATINLVNGTIKATSIQLGTQGGTALRTRIINWTDGTIENTAGANLAINSVPIALLAGTQTFNATGTNSITLDATSTITGASFGVNKTGTGTLVVNSNNTYTGATSVNEGTLLQNGNHTGGDFFYVNSGGTLGGTGSISSEVTVNFGGILAPGTSIGEFEVGSALGNGTLVIEYDGEAGTDAIDLLNVTGALDLTSLNVDFNLLSGGDALNDAALVFATYGSKFGDAFASEIDVPFGYEINYAYQGNQIALVSAGSLPGDHNGDGLVNAADYVVWRDNPNGNGGNPEGYNEWKANFGAPGGSGTANSQATVPEPSTALLAIVGLAALGVVRKWGRQGK